MNDEDGKKKKENEQESEEVLNIGRQAGCLELLREKDGEGEPVEIGW